MNTTTLSTISSCILLINIPFQDMTYHLLHIHLFNTSQPITNMANASGRPDKFVGLHFFNPVRAQQLSTLIHTIIHPVVIRRFSCIL